MGVTLWFIIPGRDFVPQSLVYISLSFAALSPRLLLHLAMPKNTAYVKDLPARRRNKNFHCEYRNRRYKLSMTSKILLILGMHRSGTSVLTRVISLLGAELPKSLLGKNESNLRGHWESEVLISDHDRLLTGLGSDWKDWRTLKIDALGKSKRARLKEGFDETVRAEFNLKADVCVIKEPRICRFAGLYIEALEDLPAEVHSVLTLRNPLEIASSLEARDGLPLAEGLLLWLTHMLEAEAATRDKPRSFIAYEDILKDPVKATQALVKSLPFALPYSANEVVGQIESYVTPSLKRQTKTLEDLALDPQAQGWVADSYAAFSVLCNNPKSKPALATLDRIRTAYFAAIDQLYTLLNNQRAVLSAGYAKDNAKTAAQNEAQIAEIEAAHQNHIKAQIAETEAAYKAPLVNLQNEIAARKTEQDHLKSELTKTQSERNEARDGLAETEAETAKAQDGLAKAENKIKSLATERDTLHNEIEFMRDEFGQLLSQAERETRQAQTELSLARETLGELYSGLDERDKTIAAQTARIGNLQGEYDAVLNSTAWKMTGGVRRVMDIVRGKRAPKSLDAPDIPARITYKDGDGN